MKITVRVSVLDRVVDVIFRNDRNALFRVKKWLFYFRDGACNNKLNCKVNP